MSLSVFRRNRWYMQGMSLSDIHSAITKAAPELRAAGLSALYLFGSQARGDASEASDIDLLFEVENDDDFSLLDQAGLQLRLQELFGRKVDFVERQALRPRMRERVEREMVRIL